MRCKKNMTLGNCPAHPLGVGFLQNFAPAYLITENGWLITFHGLNALCTAHRLHRRNAAAALLDGGDSGLPPPAQLRARVLFSVFGVVPVLRRFAARAELANLLSAAPSGAARICNRNHFHGALYA